MKLLIPLPALFIAVSIATPINKTVHEREMCVDSPKWVDDKYGNGHSNCDDMNHEWCHDYGSYSTEAKIWCPETCKVCDHAPKKVKHFQPADTALHLLDFIHAEEIDEEHEIPEGEDPIMEAIEKGHEYEGDIVLTAKEAEVIVNGTKEDKISMRTEIHESHWPKHNSLIYIPYVISDVYNTKERANIARAVKDYQDNTCVRFVPRTDQEDFIDIYRGPGCFSQLGKRGGRQTVSLGDGCVTSVGTPIHEFMHALGFWHEQMRVDRDKYVTINWENVQPGRENQFELCESCDGEGLAYDIGSVMHYHAYAFSKNRNKPTIQPKEGPLSDLGQRNGLSSGDIKGINEIYCPGYIPHCEDRDVDCPKWEDKCDDELDEEFMTETCPFTCKICTGGDAKVDKCKALDKLNYCAHWKDKWCDDNKWKRWMFQNCALSCDICKGEKRCKEACEHNAAFAIPKRKKVQARSSVIKPAKKAVKPKTPKKPASKPKKTDSETGQKKTAQKKVDARSSTD